MPNARAKMFWRTTCAVATLLACGCSGNPSVLESAAPDAGRIESLFWGFLIVTGLVFLAVMAALTWALIRSRRCTAPDTSPAAERGAGRIIGAAVAATVVILSGLVVASFAVDRGLLALEHDPFVEVEITGHQWWWEVRYLSDEPSKIVHTANELHVPIGKRVKLILKSADVIHSVWLPNLNGKRDVIPGRTTILWIEADKPGEWHGRCAEFCGYQHAHMDLTVIAEPLDSFNGWRGAQTASAREPATSEQVRGEIVFVSSNCGLCHAIRGSLADGQTTIAPDLTHLKSRLTIGAGVAPNEKGFLGGWIADPHGLKPGVNMPTTLLNPADFQALLAYLETLE